MNILYLIPARGGSKGVPHKNIKLLAGKPLIYYTIDAARELTTDDNICVSTDDSEIIKVVENYGLNVPFKRPAELSTDTASSNDVILHAIKYYESIGRQYDVIILLQPTSPLRKSHHIREAISLYNNNLDMIVSIKESHAASVLCSENNSNYLELIFNKNGQRRQEIDKYYEFNGAIYVLNISKLKASSISDMKKKKGYLMNDISSVDIDTELDFKIAEILLKTT